METSSTIHPDSAVVVQEHWRYSAEEKAMLAEAGYTVGIQEEPDAEPNIIDVETENYIVQSYGAEALDAARDIVERISTTRQALPWEEISAIHEHHIGYVPGRSGHVESKVIPALVNFIPHCKGIAEHVRDAVQQLCSR